MAKEAVGSTVRDGLINFCLGARANTRRPVSREQLMRLLGQVGLRQIWNQRTREAEREQELEDESEPDTGYGTGVGRNRKRGRGRAAFEKVPSEVGRELMESGMFATNERSLETTKRKKRLAYSIMRRELGIGSYGKQKNSSRLMLQVRDWPILACSEC